MPTFLDAAAEATRNTLPANRTMADSLYKLAEMIEIGAPMALDQPPRAPLGPQPDAALLLAAADNKEPYARAADHQKTARILAVAGDMDSACEIAAKIPFTGMKVETYRDIAKCGLMRGAYNNARRALALAAASLDKGYIWHPHEEARLRAEIALLQNAADDKNSARANILAGLARLKQPLTAAI